MPKTIQVPITFDKSHLLTIGKRLYSTSLDLIRELVSNAYDADATTVKIELSSDEIRIIDNGSGMDEARLRQYFTIGSTEKKTHSLSPKHKRKRIGEFGIGKFSALTIAERFLVETCQRESSFRACLIFDVADWNKNPENWEIPCEILPHEPSIETGTTIILKKIKKPLEPVAVIRHIRERLPIGREDFRIFVNDSEVTATAIPGRRFPVSFSTSFGSVDGEIILANLPKTKQNIIDAGVTIKVKNVSVTKSLFGFESSHSLGINRLRGWINADFLPITSSRDNIINDSDEYYEVYEGMKSVIKTVLREVKKLVLHKENTQASQVLRDALDKIGRAFKKNTEMFRDEIGDPPLGEAEAPDAKDSEEGYVISRARFIDSTDDPPPFPSAGNDLDENKIRTKRRPMSLANRAVIRKMRFGNLGIICRMERFGAEYPPSFLEQGIIYLNIDHPLYQKQMNNNSLLTMFISTLISKELALQKHATDTSAAFALQTQILTDAFKDARRL